MPTMPKIKKKEIIRFSWYYQKQVKGNELMHTTMHSNISDNEAQPLLMSKPLCYFQHPSH